MHLRKIFNLLLIIPILMFVVACSDDDNPAEPEQQSINEAEELVKYLEANVDFINTDAPSMIKSTAVHTTLISAPEEQYIIDIRAAEDYNNGHIPGAVNVSAGDIVNHYESNNLDAYPTVVIACYSGQTAGWATGLMRMLGYENVKDLKWGMCSWNESTAGSWNNNIADTYQAQLTTDASPKNEAGELPELATGETDPALILRARVEAVLAEGFGAAKTSASSVFGDLDGYYIVNYWNIADYDWGHIPGAIQYSPKPDADLELDAYLTTLPTDETIVVYCYTGQTSAHMASYLKVIGYDAKSLVFGVNGMSYTSMPGTKFVPDTDVHDYELEQ
jgi:rhodanese-related sulfurtransferase